MRLTTYLFSMKLTELNKLIESTIQSEIKNRIINENTVSKKEVFHIKCEGEPVATFDTMEEANEELPKYKKSNPDKELIIEPGVYESHGDMIDKLDEMGEKLEQQESNNMENQQPMEGNSFIKAMLDAKEKGEETFTHDDKTHNVEECWKKLEEEESIGEEEETCEECGDQSMKEGEDDFLDSAYEDRTYIEDEPSMYDDMEDNKDDFEDDGTCGMCNGTGVGGTPDQECPACNGSGYVNRKEEDDSDYTGENEMYEDKKMCSECGTMLNEQGMCSECGSGYMKESKKKVLRLKESELVKLISKMVSESIPGLEVTKKAQSGTKKETNDYVGSVQKKMKDYLSIPGNDNPEFPKQVGKGEKAAVHFDSKEDQEYVDNYRGNTSLDLDYDSEPSEKFKKRLKDALEGDSTMGNSQDAGNVIKTNTGKKLAKIADVKKKDEKTFPMYKKDSQPTTEKKVNESKVSFSNILKEEVEKMKRLTTYNKKTQ